MQIFGRCHRRAAARVEPPKLNVCRGCVNNHSKSGPIPSLPQRLQPLEAKILVFRPHRLAGVELEGDHALREGPPVLIGQIEDQPAVEVVPDMVSPGDDHDVVPIVDLHELRELGLVDDLGRDLLAFRLPRRLLAHLADSLPAAGTPPSS